MNRYGSDKPDTRYGMELIDITDEVSSSEFVVFKAQQPRAAQSEPSTQKCGIGSLEKRN